MGAGTERVLVVDDEPGVRRLLTRLLDARGYIVSEAASGHEALTCLERATPPFDLVVSDMVMPGMDGAALAAAVAGRWPAVRFLLMSGYAEGSTRHGARIPSHVPFLAKPFTAQQLVTAVRSIFEPLDLDPHEE
jgi:two-component system cell cycle sensor histidine kinase/response regulator CckA